MADEPHKDPEPVHPHDAIDPREFILTTPFGEERLADLKRVMPDRVKYGEFWVPYCASPGAYGAGFADQSNYEYFEKKYPWLHTKNSQIGLDVEEIDSKFESFEEFLITIPGDDWDSFIEDVESVENYPDIDDQRSSELRTEAEREYWEGDGFKDWLKAAKKKFTQDSFQHWVLNTLDPWEAYELCTDVSEYMEEESGGSIYFREERAVQKIAWDSVETVVDEPALRQSYEAAKAECWKGTGGEEFFAACQRHAANDHQLATGLAALTEDRLKQIYDRVVTDENISDPDLPAYITVEAEPAVEAAEGVEARAAVPQHLVVSLGEEGYEREAAEVAAVLARDMIAAGTEPLAPLEHPELPFGGNLPEGIDPKDFINQNPRSKIGDTVEGTCPKCGKKKLLGRNWPDFVEDDGHASPCENCGTPIPYLSFKLVHSVPIDHFAKFFPQESLDPKGLVMSTLKEAAPIPDPYDPSDPDKLDVRDWIVSGGPDVGELLWSTDKLYLIIPGDQHTLDKYVHGKTLESYSTTIVGVPDPQGKYEAHSAQLKLAPAKAHSTQDNFVLNEQYGEIQLQWSVAGYQHELSAVLNNELYGAELKQALIQRYRAMVREELRDPARRNEDDFKNALLMLFQVGGHEALKGFYRHIRPGQIYKFDIKYGMALLKRGRIAAAAHRFGVDRRQVTKNGYLYAVSDWSDLTGLFGEDRNHDYASAAKKVFDGETYDWFDYIQGDLKEAVEWLLPKHYAHIRELMLWSEVRNPNLDGEPFFNVLDEHGEPVGEVILNKEIMAALTDGQIDEMLQNTDEFDYDNQLEEIANALIQAHRRAQETGTSDAYYRAYTKALEAVLGPSKFQKVGKKDMLTFLVPWPDILERLNKAQEDEGTEYEGTLDDLIERYSEKAVPEDDPSPEWKEIKQWFQGDDADEMLHEIKPNPGPPPRPIDPRQPQLPLPESLLMEGYKYGCTMVHLPAEQADFLLRWGKLNIPDDVLFNGDAVSGVDNNQND